MAAWAHLGVWREEAGDLESAADVAGLVVGIIAWPLSIALSFDSSDTIAVTRLPQIHGLALI